MLFSSPEFLVFFAAYFAAHLLIPKRYRVYLIIIGSTIFYGWWKAEYVWLPYALIAISYGGVLWIERAKEPGVRRLRLALTLVCLFLPLAIFKYTDFIYRDVIGLFTERHDKILDVPLPLGISFVTFTLTAFVVDIAVAKYRSLPPFADALAYVLFFPHLIAGPILRPADLLPQLAAPRSWPIRPLAAVGIFTVGLVKKLVFADTIAAMVDAAYAADSPTAPEAIGSLYGFAAQIYCDFSGYTDMAIGLALLLGIRLPTNFKQPYCALSPVDFWRRWHITLSFWLRDYLYIPLGGNRGGALSRYRNIMATMILGGLWHGASWTFMVWGALHGVAISASHLVRQIRGAAPARPQGGWLSILLTFHFIALTWVFFRAPTFSKALGMFRALGEGWEGTPGYVERNLFPLLLTAILLLLHKWDDHRRIKAMSRRLPRVVFLVAIGFGWILAITISQGSSAKFIYFDF
jgi:alginate O-acetyltransferase complex protein AlgI